MTQRISAGYKIQGVRGRRVSGRESEGGGRERERIR